MHMEARLEKNALSTLEDTMMYMGMDSAKADVKIKNKLIYLINAASAYIETQTQRKLGQAEYVERHYGSGSQKLCLQQYPIKTVKNVRDIDNNASISGYATCEDKECGILFREEGWPVRGYPSGLSGDYSREKRYIEVTYTAGYILPKDGSDEAPADLPYDLQSAIWDIVQQQWTLSKNGAKGLQSFSISDVSWTFDKEPSKQVMSVIEHYMRWS